MLGTVFLRHKPGGCSCTHRVVGFVATNACFLVYLADGSA